MWTQEQDATSVEVRTQVLSPVAGAPREAAGPDGVSGSGRTARLARWAAREPLLLAALALGAITHGYNLFRYPLYITDEGVYVQRAWSVIREGALAPYTYNYDHAPAGWLAIAAWISLLPHQFQTFGSAENAGRALMLVVHVGSMALLFQITRRLAGNTTAAFIATFIFNCSPLAVFYQREVVLDNLMVFWVLVSLSLVLKAEGSRLLTLMLGGVAFGVSVLTKENAIFFMPALGYLLYRQVRGRLNQRFALGLTSFLALAVISVYFLYAVLKNELLPVHLDFNLATPPTGHVALLYTLWQQLHRNQGSLLDRSSPVWQFSLGAWLPKDAFLLVAGSGSMLVNLLLGLRDRQRHQGELVAGLLAGGYTAYLARGSVILEFYVVPLVPFLAMNLGMVASHVLPLLSRRRMVRGALVLGSCAALLAPFGGYLVVRDSAGRLAVADLYRLNLTGLQQQELDYVRAHISPDARIIMDEEFWVDLHDVRPYYRFAHSHFEATGDPDVRDKLFARDWHNVDYLVMSNKMLVTMQQLNTNGQYNWIFEALHHAQRIWQLQQGGIELEIWQVQR